MANYRTIYQRSIEKPDAFWAEAARALHWDRPWDRVLNFDRPPFYRWFEGGELNTCFNAVDRHVASGRGGQVAIIHDSAVTGSVRRITYAELQDLVARFAGVLVGQGVGKGDRVVIYMPMVPEAAIAMLACARIGAIHSVVFGGFAAKELATRIDDAKPVLIVAASCGIEPGRVVPYKPLLAEALARSRHRPRRCIVLQRPEGMAEPEPSMDLDWQACMDEAQPVGCTPVEATDPLYILYTSGTTGLPKGIVRDHGGHATALLWSMKNIYGVQPGEVFWTASDVGWVVGHSYIVYAPLLNGSTTVIYEGKPVGTPDAGAFWRVIAQHGVKVMFTAPTAFRAIRREDPDAELMHRHDLGGFRALFLAGERCDPETLRWAEEKLMVPVIDHWWQTETGWAIAANYLGIEHLPVKPGSPTLPAPGYDVRILGEDGQELPAGEQGAICIRLPLPPSCLNSLWGSEERFVESYMSRFPGYYLTGDAGYRDGDGYLFVMGRIDDVINVAGHRLSTGQIEEVLAAHSAVAECAVMGVADQLKGELPVGFLVLKAGVTTAPAEVEKEAIAMVRAEIGPVAAFKLAKVVKRLPKTRSGKILRGTMKKIADGTPWTMPATIDDPASLEEIGDALAQLGYPRPQ
ncbi:propionyl-CoA synthetase [Geminicoccus roseus]|uniref:propionyl-CoA synthetase n=1 Tax=Geminicoccus roseus TaxID=404900 RepID=UPI0003F7E5C2|nr:propionyl-CoA synthetase [Geminicoccus roseus]